MSIDNSAQPNIPNNVKLQKGMVIIHDEKMNKSFDEKTPEPKLKNPKRRNPF